MKRLLILVCFLLLVTTAAMAEKLESWDAVQEKFEQAYSRNARTLTFTLSPALLKEQEKDSSILYRTAARAGYHSVYWTWWTDGKVEMTTMKPFDCPFRVVQDENGMIDAVSEMRSAGAKDFALVLDPELYMDLRKKPGKTGVILKKGGLYSYGMYYEDMLCVLTYNSCEYWDGIVREVTGEKEMLEAIREMGSLGYDEFAIVTDRKTYNSLTASENRKLIALQTAAFVNCMPALYYDEHMFVYRKEGESVFYPSYVIVRAVQAGQEDSLPPRLRQTLTKAKKLLEGVSGSRADMVLAIHDLLCRHITYLIDESTEEDDCCIGAILHGMANCDGYAGAFYLLCGLKGIPARLVMGDSIEEGKSKEKNGHMWNLVLLHGKWRGMDVTWDDQGAMGISYDQYNMGMDRMKSLYIFNDTYFPSAMLRTTDLQDRPVPEYEVSTAEEVISAIRNAVSSGKEKIYLWMDSSLYRQYQVAGTMWKWLDLAGASGTDYYHDDLKRVDLCDIKKLATGIKVMQADSPQALVSKLKMNQGKSVREIRIYCSDSLYSDFRKNNANIWKWLDLGGISATYNYYPTIKMIVLTDIRKLDTSVMVLEADSPQALVSKLKQNRSKTIREYRIYCSDSLFSAYQKNNQDIWKWLENSGIKNATVYHYTETKMLQIYTK